MKKIILFLVLLFLPFNGYTQHIISVKVGLNQSKIRGDITNYDFGEKHKPFGYEWKGGLITAISVQFKPSNYLTIEPEFLFVENGFKQSYYHYYQDSIVSTQHKNFKFDYFKFSALFKWHFDKYFTLPERNISLFAIVGPNLSVLINALLEDDNYLGAINEVELYDFGITLGVGGAYQLNVSSISLELRHYLGFVNTKVFQFFSDYYDVSSETFNKSWEIMIGYSFPLVK